MMLGNCENIITKEWPQENQVLDDRRRSLTMDSSSSSLSAANQVMPEKTNNQTGPKANHHQPLQCPRCNSSNTKFCYYNNYSLSQPRHFCKACKRYWTRGGTLRNVPVGGGCRKNKRVKRNPPPLAGISSAASTATPNPKIDLSPASSRINNPLFYSLATNNNPLEPLNLPFSSFSSTRVCDNNTGFDFQPQINGLGLGFSSGGNPIIFGSSASASSSTMASLLASSFQQQKSGTNYGSFKDMLNEAANGGPGLIRYEETQMPSTGNGSLMGKDVRFELGENRLAGWNPNSNPNPLEQMVSSDPSSLIWNTTNLGAWFDPSNSSMNSSVPSLI